MRDNDAEYRAAGRAMAAIHLFISWWMAPADGALSILAALTGQIGGFHAVD